MTQNNVFLFLANENRKHYQTMAKMFPKEKIWSVALKDTESIIKKLERVEQKQ